MTTTPTPTSAYGWFETLEPGRRDVLREDRWALAEAAWAAARSLPRVSDEMVERAAMHLHAESGDDVPWSVLSTASSHVLTADRYRTIARGILEAASDEDKVVPPARPWLSEGEPVTTRHVADLADGIRSGQAEEETILRFLERLLEPRAVGVPTPEEEALRLRVEELEKDVARLRRLDSEYGRLESLVVMLDPEFDGDGEGECIDRLVDSVRRLAARGKGNRARLDVPKIEDADRQPFEGLVLGRHGDEGTFGAELLGSVRIHSPAELLGLRVPFIRRDEEDSPSPDAPGTKVAGHLVSTEKGVRIVEIHVVNPESSEA